MPQLLAFSGLRPEPAITGPLDEVVCPPYDIISERERLELLGRSPYNVVRIELPNGHYDEAARLLHEWESTGALARENQPALYAYRMSYISAEGDPRQTLGVIGALVLEPPGQGILPHEETTPKAKSDRLELIRATEANTSPIWCLCSERGLTDALGDPPGNDTGGASEAASLIASAQDDEGTLHEIWPMFGPAVHEKVAKIIQAQPVLVADGHHRYETALTYQAERTERAPSKVTPPTSTAAGPFTGRSIGGVAGYDAVLALVVELSEQHLQVMAIHRVVSGLPAGYDLLAGLEPSFELSRTAIEGPALLTEMLSAGALAVLTETGNWLAKPRPGGPVSAYDLDSSRIDAALRGLPAHELSYEHDPGQARAEVRSGDADAAVLCRPATVRQIAQTAHGGVRMPPKTTFFWPKPRTGMVLRDFGPA
jgi:uncharacterized protein (DUF1015 family)